MTVSPVSFWKPKPAIAWNVDPTTDGGIRSRRGTRMVLPMAVDGAWSDGKTTLVQSRTLLFLVTGDQTFTTQLVPGTVQIAPVDVYGHLTATDFAGLILWSNGQSSGVIDNGVARTWGVERPDVCTVLAGANGNLPAGRYLAALAYQRNDGYVSGLSDFMPVDVADGGGSIQLTNLPASVNPMVSTILIWLTWDDGTVPRLVGAVDNGTPSWSCINGPELGGSEIFPEELDGDPPPENIRWIIPAWGRIVLAVGNALYWSGADPERFSHGEAFFQFDTGAITGLGFTGDALYIGTQQAIYRLTGGLPDEDNMASLLTRIADCGMVDGSMASHPGKTGRVVWTQTDGAMVEGVAGAGNNKIGDTLPGILWIRAYAGIDPQSGAYHLYPIINPVAGSMAVVTAVPVPAIL